MAQTNDRPTALLAITSTCDMAHLNCGHVQRLVGYKQWW